MNQKLHPIILQLVLSPKPAIERTYPTKLGRIVHERAMVLTGMLSVRARLRPEKATKYGPIAD